MDQIFFDLEATSALLNTVESTVAGEMTELSFSQEYNCFLLKLGWIKFQTETVLCLLKVYL